jgi:hypothetical protein
MKVSPEYHILRDTDSLLGHYVHISCTTIQTAFVQVFILSNAIDRR